MGLKIEVRNNNVEQAMRVMKRKLMKDGIMKELRQRESYEKPSEKKRRKKKENIANYKKKMKKLMAMRGF